MINTIYFMFADIEPSPVFVGVDLWYSGSILYISTAIGAIGGPGGIVCGFVVGALLTIIVDFVPTCGYDSLRKGTKALYSGG